MTEPTLPPAPDDSDVGWEPAPASDEDDEAVRRLIDDRPPHWDSP